MWWALVAMFLAIGAVPSAFRLAAGICAGLACLVVPVMARGALGAAVPGLMPRQRRIAQRRPYWDPVAGKEVRPPRPAPPAWIRRITYAADRYRCVWCRRRRGTMRPDGSVVVLNLDHIQPYALGFNISLWNCATLCDVCNKIKSSYWKSPQGKVYYRPFAHADAMGQAGQIARREMRNRLRPDRWARAGLAWWRK